MARLVPDMAGRSLSLGRQLGEARRVVGQTLEICTDVELVAGVGFSNQALGQAEGALPEAKKYLTDALRALNSIRARFEVGRTRLFLASLAAVRGDRGAAAANLREAHSLFRTLRIPKYVERRGAR